MSSTRQILFCLCLANVALLRVTSAIQQEQLVSQCAKETNLVYHEKGDVTATALLDLTQGPECKENNAASTQSMNGILQTFRTLNSIQYLKGLKLGIRIYDTCSQENSALKAVLETALEANLTQSLPCREGVHLGFLFPIRSYPTAVQLLNFLNVPVTDISYWQTTSPLDAVADLLIRMQWSSIALICQSKQTLLGFSKKASDRRICIVAQTVLSPINRTKEMTVRAVRRSKRSGSKVYVLIGSSEFLLNVLPYFNVNGTSTNPPAKFVLVAADNWNSNFSIEVAENVPEALIIRPQRVLTDDNISARVLYSLVKQFKIHLSSTCNGQVSPCEFEPHHLMKKTVLADEDLKILKLSKDISIYNELFPVTYISRKTPSSPVTIVDIGNIHEDKFIPSTNLTFDREESADCSECLCTNVDSAPELTLQLRSEVYIIMIGSTSVLAMLFALTGLLLLLYLQCCSSQQEKSGSFIFLLIIVVLVLLSVSLLFILIPSSIVCLSRMIALSGAYTMFFAALFAVAASGLVGTKHQGDKPVRLCVLILIFIFSLGVQVPVLTYETLFRDETLLINKVLTDYGPKTECTLDDWLSMKLFIYPVILLTIASFASVTLIVNHWSVSRIKINFGITSLACLLINAAWGVCYIMLEKQWRETVILVGVQGNAFAILLGIVTPKVMQGFKSIHQPYPDVTAWQGGSAASQGNMPEPPRMPPPQHIYAIPGERQQRRPSDSLSDYDRSTAM